MSAREERLEGALEIAMGRLAQISRGHSVSRTFKRNLSASEAQRTATAGINEVMRALAGQEVRYTPCQTKIVLGPEGRDAASDVLRAVGWTTTPLDSALPTNPSPTPEPTEREQ